MKEPDGRLSRHGFELEARGIADDVLQTTVQQVGFFEDAYRRLFEKRKADRCAFAGALTPDSDHAGNHVAAITAIYNTYKGKYTMFPTIGEAFLYGTVFVDVQYMDDSIKAFPVNYDGEGGLIIGTPTGVVSEKEKKESPCPGERSAS